MSDAQTVLALFAGQPVDQDSIAHYRGLLERRLLMHRCRECGWWHHPPRPICPQCWSSAVVAEEVSGRGHVHLVTFLHGAGGDPHPVLTVELDEQAGLRFTATTGTRCGPRDVRIGARVTLGWTEADGLPVPVFHIERDE